MPPAESSPIPRRVLVTGSAGVVGRAVCQELLARGHFVRGFDLSPSPHASESVTGSITEPAELDAAMASIDTLVHLAAEPNECDFLTRLLPSNIIGVYHVMDAARRHGLRRVVLTSSVMVNGRFVGLPEVIRLERPTSPTTHYAVTKLFAESIGRMYATVHKLSVLVVRLAWVVRTPEEVDRMVRMGAQPMYTSRGDAGRFFAAGVEAEAIDYKIVYASSKPTADAVGVDLEPARKLLGYEPRDTFPEGLPFAWPARS
jgi:uronate dehydrogenase